MTAGASSGNLADRFVATVEAVGDRDAIVVAGPEPTRLTYAALRARVERLASVLHGRGVRRGDRVGVHLANGNEHVEVLLASFLLGAAPVNLSHRDTADDVRAVLEDSGARTVIHEPDVASDAPVTLARGAAYEAALRAAPPMPSGPPRSGADEYVLYTSGSTGRPRGVRWRHEDLYDGALHSLPHASRSLIASPFAHGTGQWMVLRTLLHGGTVVCRRDRVFDPEAMLDTVDDERVSFLTVVGDAFAVPIVALLDACPGRWTLSSLTTILSGGAVLSADVKRALLDHLPTTLVVDGFGASETGGHGRMVSVPGVVPDGPPRFVVDDLTEVLDDDGRPLPAGSDRVGWLARRGSIPLGTVDGHDADTFRVVDGVRWALTGDRAVRQSDGTVVVLGRGASTITTGGHKVQAEEIEACVRSHPAIADVVVVGLPDERFGQRVVAVVAARHDATPTLDSVRRHCRRRLAAHKLPRDLVVVDRVRRSAAGKPDYGWAREVASS